MRFPARILAFCILSLPAMADPCSLSVPELLFDRNSLVTVKGCTLDPAAKYEVLINGFAATSRIGTTGAVFELLPEGKAPDGFWKLLDASPQPVEVELSLRKNGAAEGESTKKKLYSRPAVVGDGKETKVSKGETLQLTVANRSQLLQAAGNDTLFLFLDGRPMGIRARTAVDPNASTARFLLTAEGAQQQESDLLLPSWRTVMASKGYDKVKMPLALGTASKILTVTTDPPVTVGVERIEGWRLYSWLGFVAAVLVALFYLGAASELLREKCPAPASGRRAFSLARVQMAFWFAIVLCAVCLFWAVLGEELAVPVNLLALMGISGGTYVLAQLVDSGNAASAATPVPTSGFWRDLLTSANGIELHRFQLIVWTLVFGIMFISEFARTLVLPDPSSTSLTLMGLSSSLYVSLKVPEKKV